MFSKVYKQKFFFIPAKGKKAQAFENTRVFRKLAFKGSSRNSAIKDIRGYREGQKNAMAGITGSGKGISGIPRHTQTCPDTQEKKKHSMFSRAYAKRTIFDHNSLILLGFFISP